MKCPHCRKELDVPEYAWMNADTYSKRCHVVTECCGRMVAITPIRSFLVAKSNAPVDDWGKEPAVAAGV